MNKPLLALALVGTVLAAVFAPQEGSEDVVAPVKRAPHAASSASAASSEMLHTSYQLQVVPRNYVSDNHDTLAKAESKSNAGKTLGEKVRDPAEKLASPAFAGNIFATTNWAPPPPPPPKPTKPAKPTPPPPPVAPPLPFQYMGRWLEEGKTYFFLRQGERNLVVRVGEVIEHQYKLDSAQGGQLSFTYLPLQQQQSLAVGEVN